MRVSCEGSLSAASVVVLQYGDLLVRDWDTRATMVFFAYEVELSCGLVATETGACGI